LLFVNLLLDTLHKRRFAVFTIHIFRNVEINFLVLVHSKCIFLALEKSSHILFKLSANLLIAAIALCVMFGNGTHVHTVFDHFSDHGDIHAFVHVHPVDSKDDHNPEFDDEDTHQHPTATVELAGTLTQKTSNKVFSDTDGFSAVGGFTRSHVLKEQNPELLDLPPPDFIVSPQYFSSLFLRGPPLG